MVSTFKTYSGRLEFIAQACQFPTDAAFAAAVGVKPQNLRNWRQRESIGKDSLAKIKAGTGASLDWLTSGTGTPFPDGPLLYSGAGPTTPEAVGRIVELERAVENLTAALGMVISRLADSVPAAAAAIAADLEGYLSSSQEESAVLLALHEAAGHANRQSQRGGVGTKRRSAR